MISIRSASSCESRLRRLSFESRYSETTWMPSVVAPLQELAHLRRAGAVAVRGRLVAELARPAAVAVDHHRDVVRHGRGLELAAQAIDVEPVERPSALRSTHSHAYATAARAATRAARRHTVTRRLGAWPEHEFRRASGRLADEGADMPQLPLLEAAAFDAQVEIKPTWRGWIHAGTFPVAIAAGIVLIALAQGAAGQVGLRGLHGDLAAAVRQLGALSPLQLGPEDQGGAQAHRPREHLAADRGHLHADRRARPAAREGHPAAVAGVDAARCSASCSACSGSTRRAGSTSRCTWCSAGPR